MLSCKRTVHGVIGSRHAATEAWTDNYRTASAGGSSTRAHDLASSSCQYSRVMRLAQACKDDAHTSSSDHRASSAVENETPLAARGRLCFLAAPLRCYAPFSVWRSTVISRGTLCIQWPRESFNWTRTGRLVLPWIAIGHGHHGRSFPEALPVNAASHLTLTHSRVACAFWF